MRIRLRHITILLAAVLLPCGCNHDTDTGEQPVTEPVEQGTPIAFNSTLSEEQAVTRSTPLESVFSFFKVYGFKNTDAVYSTYQTVFPGYTVNWVNNTANSSATNTDGWEYVNQQALGETEQTIKYWDWSAIAYRFFAVAGAGGTNVVEATLKTINEGEANEYKAYELTYKADAKDEHNLPYYSHLWFSTGEPEQPKFGQPVQLVFVKPLSTVRFKFIFEDPSKAKDTELTEKRFHPTDNNTIKTSGKVTITYPLTGSEFKESFHTSPEAGGISAFTQDYYESVSPAEGMVTFPYLGAYRSPLKMEYTVLPAIGQGTYTLSVNVGGDTKSTIVPAEFMDWLPGYSYTYIFKVHVDGSVAIDAVPSAFTEWEYHEALPIVYNW